MSEQDFKVVTLRGPKKANPTTKNEKEKQVVHAQQTGQKVITQTKGQQTNKQRSNDFDVRKLDKDEGDYSVKTVNPDIAKRIIQARAAKKLTQKDLAMAIQETVTVVQQYEQAKAVPNQKILSKIERALGTGNWIRTGKE
eukprot:TRINITY_DN429_c0_g1_i1.p1 TRINITY_DN429_c0_g1~~TRINITY_DN429_c0_g1_i1.p1  ORF type:complete len:140 (+),score=31.17 TRINITY_DN429_c0_g1_i1:109-528(+)